MKEKEGRFGVDCLKGRRGPPAFFIFE